MLLPMAFAPLRLLLFITSIIIFSLPHFPYRKDVIRNQLFLSVLFLSSYLFLLLPFAQSSFFISSLHLSFLTDSGEMSNVILVQFFLILFLQINFFSLPFPSDLLYSIYLSSFLFTFPFNRFPTFSSIWISRGVNYSYPYPIVPLSFIVSFHNSFIYFTIDTLHLRFHNTNRILPFPLSLTGFLFLLYSISNNASFSLLSSTTLP